MNPQFIVLERYSNNKPIWIDKTKIISVEDLGEYYHIYVFDSVFIVKPFDISVLK